MNLSKSESKNVIWQISIHFLAALHIETEICLIVFLWIITFYNGIGFSMNWNFAFPRMIGVVRSFGSLFSLFPGTSVAVAVYSLSSSSLQLLLVNRSSIPLTSCKRLSTTIGSSGKFPNSRTKVEYFVVSSTNTDTRSFLVAIVR